MVRPISMPKKLTKADNGRQLEVQQGDRFVVTLAGNPTTGYQWKVASVDTAIAKQIGAAQFEPASTAVGAGGILTLQFQAVGAGQTKLTLVYQRPFDKQTPPAQTFEVTVVVK